eukprot:8252043-Ditylum_brightwellii.AAC.1
MMPIVAISVTEAELFAIVFCVQDMLCAMRLLTSMGLKVKLPIVLYLDNMSAKDFEKNWKVGGCTRHIKVKKYFLCKMKEACIIECRWKKGQDMTSTIFTKNCAYPMFEKYAFQFIGISKHMTHDTHKGRVMGAVDCEYLCGS